MLEYVFDFPPNMSVGSRNRPRRSFCDGGEGELRRLHRALLRPRGHNHPNASSRPINIVVRIHARARVASLVVHRRRILFHITSPMVIRQILTVQLYEQQGQIQGRSGEEGVYVQGVLVVLYDVIDSTRWRRGAQEYIWTIGRRDMVAVRIYYYRQLYCEFGRFPHRFTIGDKYQVSVRKLPKF